MVLNYWIMLLKEEVNFVDTAEIYPHRPKKETYGKSEEIIGNWLKTKNNRDKIILASKVASGILQELDFQVFHG